MKLNFLPHIDYDMWSYACTPAELEAVHDYFAFTGAENPGFTGRSGVFSDTIPTFDRDAADALLNYVHVATKGAA